MMDLKAKWFDSINQIEIKDWNNLFGESKIVKSYAFSKVVEQSSLTNYQIFYLVVYDDKSLIAILPCFIYSFKLEILSGDTLKSWIINTRKIFPNILVKKILGIGSPVATCENHIGIDPYIDSDQRKLLGDFIVKELMNFSKKLEIDLIIVKEIPENELDDFKLIFSNRFKFFESLPNSFVPISGSFDPYPLGLRKKYRQRVSNAIKVSDKANIKWELVEDFSSLSTDIYNLYFKVYQKSKYKFEQLNPEFFENVNCMLQKKSFLLVAKNSNNVILAVELILEDKECLIPLYLGLNYENIDNTKVYQNVIFRALIEGKKRDKSYVVLGQTSYLPKSYSGCLFERLYLGVHFKKSFSNLILNLIFPYLFSPFEKPHVNCYKEHFINDLNLFMKSINRIPV